MSFFLLLTRSTLNLENSLPGFELRDGYSAWDAEARTRNFMTQQLRTYVDSLPSETQTLVVMSDIDELPARHTLALLRPANSVTAFTYYSEITYTVSSGTSECPPGVPPSIFLIRRPTIDTPYLQTLLSRTQAGIALSASAHYQSTL